MDKNDVFLPHPINTVLEGCKITYLGLKLCAVFLRIACSSIIVLVQSLFQSRETMKKMLPSLVT